jgi:UDP-3-O-[3-hydroxymyristoyl] glucosamine N-acyltransferase
MTSRQFTLEELAQITGAKLIGDPGHTITGIDALESATRSDASFLANLSYASLLHQSQAGVVCIDPSFALVEGKNFLVSDNPSRTFQQIIEIFLSAETRESGFKGVHPTAAVHPETHIADNVTIGPYAVIDRGAKIGAGTKIGACVSIGPGVEIGIACTIYPHVTIRECCIIGNRVTIQPGAVIGSCGFGYTTDARGVHTKLDQVGTVVIEDDVEIGANATIDRGRFKETRIGQGSKIDNLVQIAHNVQIGPNNIIIAQVGIAGSTRTGRNVVLGGQVGVIGHLELGDGVMVAARGGVSKSLPKRGKYAGAPAMPLTEHNRKQVHLNRIEGYVKQIESLEKRLNALENTTDRGQNFD